MKGNQRSLHLALWIAQWALAGGFLLVGFVKLGLPGDDPARLHAMGALEIAIALAAILPATTRVLPRLAAVAAAALGMIALCEVCIMLRREGHRQAVCGRSACTV